MRQVHVGGEKLFVDYAGHTVPIVDAASGEIRAAQIFVAATGASSYTYACATATQTAPGWVGSLIGALEAARQGLRQHRGADEAAVACGHVDIPAGLASRHCTPRARSEIRARCLLGCAKVEFRSMASPKTPRGFAAPTDKQVQELLARHRCPTPLHELRTLLLGNIASPRLDVSPMAPLAQAWGGALPEFASSAEVEELMRVLVQGLWNGLSEHQSARNPFRLPRFEVQPDRRALHDLARMRAQELKGFVDGLFGDEDEMLLPQKAHDAVVALADLHAMFDDAATLLADATKPAATQELKTLLRNLQQMTIAADENINKAVQSCKRSRGQRLENMATAISRRSGNESSDKSEHQEAIDSGDDEYEIIESPLSQQVTRNGVTVKVDIYADNDGKWILEVVDAENASHVWDERFATDALALAEALRALDEEPLEFAGRTADRPLN
jgi:hypothetical protein